MSNQITHGIITYIAHIHVAMHAINSVKHKIYNTEHHINR